MKQFDINLFEEIMEHEYMKKDYHRKKIFEIVNQKRKILKDSGLNWHCYLKLVRDELDEYKPEETKMQSYYKENKQKITEKAYEKVECPICGKVMIKNNLVIHMKRPICKNTLKKKKLIEDTKNSVLGI